MTHRAHFRENREKPTRRPGFRHTLGDLPDHEDLVGDIYFDDQLVCLLTQEEGFAAMKIELFAPPDGSTWKFRLTQLEAALSALKDHMWERRLRPPAPQ